MDQARTELIHAALHEHAQDGVERHGPAIDPADVYRRLSRSIEKLHQAVPPSPDQLDPRLFARRLFQLAGICLSGLWALELPAVRPDGAGVDAAGVAFASPSLPVAPDTPPPASEGPNGSTVTATP